jgi:uncharacterized repeat protein (TIGR03803 family)
MKIIVPFSALILFVATSRINAEVYAYTSLHIFSAKSVTSPNTNADGATPSAGLTLVGDTLYGMANSGGSSNVGTIFKLKADGSQFTTLYNFTNGTDGASPGGSEELVFSNNALFGVTGFGGTNVPRRGAVFRVNADGTGFTNLYSFHGSDGQNPAAGLILSGDTLYGTAHGGGGTGKHGTIFKINTDGSGFAMLFAFSGTNGGSPSAPLVLSGNTLYGSTLSGSNGEGSIFRIDTDGNNFTNLYSFTGGLDGALPESALTLAGNSLFGTTTSGGISNYGTVFRINTDGSGFTVLHGFTSTWDAGEPFGGLVSIGNRLYGTALSGSSSSSNYGTVYRINTDGSGFTNVYQFTGGSDGAGPIRTLALSGNTFYGAAAVGGVAFGANGNGALFALTFPVSLSISRLNNSNLLSWPSPSTGFVLQTNADTAKTSWGNYGAGVNDGTNQTVTVPSSTDRLFFRLSHP